MNRVGKVASLLLFYIAIVSATNLTCIFWVNVAQAQVPEVITNAASNITPHSATLSGNLTSLGNYTSANVCFEWGTISGNLTQETLTQTINSTGAFSDNLSGLSSSTTYYFRAKASANVTVYGDELSFTTEMIPPEVITNAASNITPHSATLSGNLTSMGDYTSVDVCFEWGMISGNLTQETATQTINSTGAFSDNLSGLSSNTTYYFRAKATPVDYLDETVYGDELSFTTERSPPEVTTNAASNITPHSATLSGNLTSLGDYTSANVCFEWGTISGNLTQETLTQTINSTGAFSDNLSGLSSNTTYYFRTKASANVTVYGDELSFTTEMIPPEVITEPTTAASNITSSSATLSGNLTSLGDYTSANVSFEWGTISGNLTQETATQTINSTGAFSDNLSGLSSNTTYYFRAKTSASVTVYGDELSFITEMSPPEVITEPTTAASNITSSSATLSGNLTSLGDYTSANVCFEWGTSSGNLTQETVTQTINSTGTFSDNLSGLSSNTTYYFRSKATVNPTVYGDELSFTTLGGGNGGGGPPQPPPPPVEDGNGDNGNGGHRPPEPTTPEPTTPEPPTPEPPTPEPPTPEPPTPEPPTPEPVVPSPENVAEIIKRILEGLPWGQMVFNPPEEMTVGVKERIEVRISQDSHEGLTEELRGRGVPVVEPIKVGTFMKVSLMGDNFDIQTLSSPEQLIVPGEFTEWVWDVVPLESGQQTLHLCITTRVKIPGYEEERRDLPIMDKHINVKVNLPHSIIRFITSNWQWLIVTLIIPLGALVFRKFFKIFSAKKKLPNVQES